MTAVVLLEARGQAGAQVAYLLKVAYLRRGAGANSFCLTAESCSSNGRKWNSGVTSHILASVLVLPLNKFNLGKSKWFLDTCLDLWF